MADYIKQRDFLKKVLTAQVGKELIPVSKLAKKARCTIERVLDIAESEGWNVNIGDGGAYGHSLRGYPGEYTIEILNER